MRGVQELEQAYERAVAGRPPTASLREVRWMLEELRVSHFAQALGTRGQVSSKRIRRALEEAAAAAP
jgi:ATP-dependent helicase HrpA